MTLSKRFVLSLTLLSLLWSIGCISPGVRVKPNPDPDDKGIRYYRPKPYLFIAPATLPKESVKATKPDKSSTEVTTEGGLTDQYVSIELQMLPDYSEEYSIRVTAGTGTANVKITLEDGWNLTGLDQDLDSKFNENIKAFADLIKTVAPNGILGAPSTPASGTQTMNITAIPKFLGKAVVKSSNVPIGYYEAVIGRDQSGRKQQYGWRYLGFSPYRRCPQIPCGSDHEPCDSLDLYGLVWRNGVMTFDRLHSVERIGPVQATTIVPQGPAK